TISAAKRSKEQRRLEARWRNELHRQKAPLNQRLQSLEQTIEEITNRLDELNELLAHPDTYENGVNIPELNREYQELKRSLEDKNRKWEEAAIELEALEESFWEEKRLGE
ncbi:MAG: hypothetical protein JSW07_22705, partial [bacterium]